MRTLGITYDTGFLPGLASRPVLDPDAVRRDLAVIATELRCDAVRITGGDPDRLDLAAGYAAERGLAIWYSPFPVDLSPDAMRALYADCAGRAERLRAAGASVVFVTGCETSAFGAGFVPGDTYLDRMRAMATADMDWWLSLGPVAQRLNAFLAESVSLVRQRFRGPVTYASGPWEPVDWTPYDIVGVDAYRTAANAGTFPDEVRAHGRHGKPVAVTEFGTCAYRGAGARGGTAWVVPEGAVPDESEQVGYLTELLDVFDGAGVDTAFWFTFAQWTKPGDADLGSYGLVRMLDDVRWAPKAAFRALADRYAARRDDAGTVQ